MPPKEKRLLCLTYLNLQLPQRQSMGDCCLDRTKTNGGSNMERGAIMLQKMK